ncbi:unnamed protein product [Orchesella dallaii]|uniref:G-protein coupled receptors family 1 profile domain-containing protein n=1 Tax=Orchesella dallaii TaxID=48710 RepID=A0ABP1QP74_9HEXA
MLSVEFHKNISNFTSFEVFNPIFCYLLDMPKSRKDCSIQVPGKCIYCPIPGLYFTGESINDFDSPGHITCRAIWILTVGISLFGIFSNIIIISIFSRRSTKNSFNLLIIMLAIFDFLCCLMTISACTSDTAYFENWTGRGKRTLYWYYLSISCMYFVRSGSTFTTILITIERYLVITYPLKSACWFTSRNTKITAFCVLILAALLAFPRFTMYVDTNDLTDIPSLNGLTHILRSTKLNRFFYVTLKTLHSQIDFWLPFPILLIFNILSFRKVQRIAQKRKESNMFRSERKDIRATKMFLPVSIVLFLCNIEFVITYICVLVFKIVFRENTQKAFNFLIVMLAVFDLFCCIATIVTSTGDNFYFENWSGRGGITLHFCYLSLCFMYFARSGSTFTTMLITIERYLIIAYPVKSANLFTSRRAKILSFFIPILAAILTFPRFTMYVDTNDLTDIPSISKLTHIIRATELNKFFYVTLNTIHSKIDFWLPLPVLLFFNILSFRHVRRIAKKRNEMNLSRNQKKDIRAVKMFLPVVVVLFLCNVEFVITYIIILHHRIVYRELLTLLFLFVAINSSANLPIYYFREAQFKAETRVLLNSWFPFLKLKGNDENTGTNTSNAFTSNISKNGIE